MASGGTDNMTFSRKFGMSSKAARPLLEPSIPRKIGTRATLAGVLLCAGLTFMTTSDALAHCSYDLNGVGYGDNCPYLGGGSTDGGTYVAPPSPAEIAAQQAYALNEDGISAMNAGNYARAEQLFDQASKKTPYDATIAGNLKAARNLQRFQAVFPQGVDALKSQNYAEAIRYFEQADSIIPNSPTIQKWLELARDGVKDQTMLSLNDQGNTSYNTQDYAAAVRYYEQALKNVPNGVNAEALKNNLQNARDRLKADTEETERRVVNTESLKSLTEALKSAKSSSTSQDTARQSDPKSAAPALAFMPASGTGTNAFGTANADPANPPGELHTLDMKTEPPPPASVGTDTNALDQLKSAAGSSVQAAEASSEEEASKLAGKTFDRRGDRSDGAHAPDVSVSVPRSEPVYSPEVTLALAANKDYQELGAQHDKAIQEETTAQHQLDELNRNQKTETDNQKRQAIQIKIADAAQKLQTAKSAGAAIDIKRDEIVKKVVYKVKMLSADGDNQGPLPSPPDNTAAQPILVPNTK